MNAVTHRAALTSGFVPAVISGGLSNLSATPTPEVSAARALASRPDAERAASLVVTAFLALGSTVHAAPGRFEVPVGIPLCSRVSMEMQRAFQSTGICTTGLTVTESGKPNHVELSWSSPRTIYSGW